MASNEVFEEDLLRKRIELEETKRAKSYDQERIQNDKLNGTLRQMSSQEGKKEGWFKKIFSTKEEKKDNKSLQLIREFS